MAHEKALRGETPEVLFSFCRHRNAEAALSVPVLGHHRVVGLGVLERLLNKCSVVPIPVYRLMDHRVDPVSVLILVIDPDHLRQGKAVICKEDGLIVVDERPGSKELHIREPPRRVIGEAILDGHPVPGPALLHPGDSACPVIDKVEDSEAVPGDLGQAPIPIVYRNACGAALLRIGTGNQCTRGVKGGLVEDDRGHGSPRIVGTGDLSHPVDDRGDVPGGIHGVLRRVCALNRKVGKGNAGHSGGERLLQGDDIHGQRLLNRPVDRADVRRIPHCSLHGEG